MQRHPVKRLRYHAGASRFPKIIPDMGILIHKVYICKK